MTIKNKAQILSSYLDEILPNARCELLYSNDYELVIAVMLSAQTTDASVNLVTPILFSKYKSLEELANADVKDIETIIKPLGMYKNKAANIIGIANELITSFNGVVPSNKDDLQTLPGVGNKTAGVIRAEIFNIPDLPVDTHILRISKRLGLVDSKADPLKTELKLKKIIEKEKWIKTHHQLIHFGRYFCKARGPICKGCKLQGFCKDFKL